MKERLGKTRQFRKHYLSATRYAAAGVFALTAICGAKAQMPGTEGQMGSSVPSQTAIGSSGGGMTDTLQYGTMGHDVMREEAAAYQTFLKQDEPIKKIKSGNEFLKRYPKSTLVEQVDVGMMNAYRERQDWPDAFQWGDRALALQPDDVDVLTIVAWTTAHVSKPSDPDADQQLSKAETEAKHAIDVMNAMKKPPKMSETDFESAKAKRMFQAHSALGIVYFRRNDYDDSAKELTQATKGNATPDPTDLFILGVDLQNLKRYDEAAEAYRGCGAIAGPLQDRCKQTAGAVAQAASQPNSQ